MRDQRLTGLFVRFRDRHDGKALAQLFDASARELLGVAAHLVDDASQAEDLVQTTFQVAIERAPSFDPTHSVMGWLYGILWRESAKLRRERARTVDAKQLSPTRSADPLSDAIAGELPRMVSQALADLPARYREVLVPLLCEDRTAGDIARDLGRAPGTVRVQIQRGLERLRKSLPRSLSLSGVAIVPGKGLESVRHAALRHAGLDPALYPTASVFAGVGAGMVGWSFLLSASTVLAAVVALGIWARTAFSSPDRVDDTALGHATARQGPHALEAKGTWLEDLPGPDQARAPAAQPAGVSSAQAVPRTERVSVSGQVTASGEPCPRAVVWLAGPAEAGRLIATADSDGRYQIDGVLPGPYVAFVHDSEPGSLAIDVDVLVQGADQIADFELPSGSIEGTIQGIELPPKVGPLGRVRVFPRNGRPETGNVGQFVEPDEQGRFIARNLRPGEYTVWFVDADDRTHRKAVVLDELRPRAEVLFEPAQSIGGVVGRLIGLEQSEGTTVDAYPIDASGPDLAAAYGGQFHPESGRFEITDLEPGRYGLLVWRWKGAGAPHGLKEFLWVSPFEVSAGTETDLGGVPMQRGRSVDIRLDKKSARATWRIRMPSGDWLSYVMFCGGRSSGHRAPEQPFFLPYGEYPLQVDFGNEATVETILVVEPGTGAVELAISAPPR